MGRYSLVAYTENPKEKLILYGKENLEQIDFFTSSFESLMELENFIKKEYNLTCTKCRFRIEYTYNKEVRTLDVFVKNPLLKECARYCLERKKYKAKENLTDAITTFKAFRKRILYYIYQKETFRLLKEDKKGLVPYQLKEVINAVNREIIENSSYLTQEKNELEEKIIYILSDYKNMRKMMIWETLYLSGKLNLPKTVIQTSTSYTFQPRDNYDFTDDYDFKKSSHVDPDEYAFLSDEELQQMEGTKEEGKKWR